MTDTLLDLCGKFLIAMPSMGDERFAHSVVYLCAHSEDGAMGLVVNKPAPNIAFKELLEQLEITGAPGTRDLRVHIGGPVEHSRGFVLHGHDYTSDGGTLKVDDHVALTATLDVLEDIAKGEGPASTLLALGYAGWGPGQLESELAENAWLVSDAAPEIIFSGDHDTKWLAALQGLGIDPLTLSATGGRA